jgi:hypothetical protein
MTENEKNPTDDLLSAAITGIAQTDPALAGSTPVKWVLVAEHRWDDGEGQTFSVFRSPDLMPWDALGLLQMALIKEEQRAIAGPRHGDESDD